MDRIAGYRERQLVNYTCCRSWPPVRIVANEVDAHEPARSSRTSRLGLDRKWDRAQLGVVRRVAPDIGTSGTVASWDVRIPMACGDYHCTLFRSRDAKFYPFGQRLLVDDSGDDVLATDLFSDTLGTNVKMEITLLIYLAVMIGIIVFIMEIVP